MIRPQADDQQHGRRAACSTAAAMRGKVGSEFETYISYNAMEWNITISISAC